MAKAETASLSPAAALGLMAARAPLTGLSVLLKDYNVKKCRCCRARMELSSVYRNAAYLGTDKGRSGRGRLRNLVLSLCRKLLLP